MTYAEKPKQAANVKARKCRKCHTDLAATYRKKGNGRTGPRLPALVELTIRRVRPDHSIINIHVAFCPMCVPAALQVLEDEVLS